MQKRHDILIGLCTCLLLFATTHVFAQQKTITPRPKVGLVLSGGGAKGFAHIGILKVLEASGVAVDYIAGTSMGAVIGGLYASGYSASEIDSIFNAIDFNQLLRDQLPRNQTAFFEKQFGEKHLLTFPIQKDKVSLPKALATGQSVYNRLSTLFSHVAGITDFSKLPIPFFCVATDLETGKPHYFDQGYLPAAVRASASLPSLLEPMEIDSVSYIDGGVSDNFPVEEMRKRGVQLLIGVDVQKQLSSKENLNSVLEILNQIINYPMHATGHEKKPNIDLLLRPDLSDFSVSSFSNVAEIVQLGQDAAAQNQEAFDRIAAIQMSGKRKKQTSQFSKVGNVKVTKFGMNPLKNYSRAYVLGKLKLEEGDSLTYDQLDTRIGGLSSSKDFGLIQYKFESQEGQGHKLNLTLKENAVSSFLKVGLHYDPLYKTALLLNYTKKHLIQKNDIFAVDFIFGDQPRVQLNYFVDNGFYTSYGVSSRFNKLTTSVAYSGAEVNSINKSYVDFTTLLYLQTTFNKKFATGFGLEHKFLELFTKALATSAENQTTFFEKSSYLNALAYIKLDSYDRKFAPRNGFLVDGEFKGYLSSTDYNANFNSFSQFKLQLAAAKTVYQKLTIHLSTEGGVTIGNNTSGQFLYSLGGYADNMINNYIPFYGYDFEDLQSNSYLKTTLELRYEFVKKHSIAFISNYANTAEDLFRKGALFKDAQSGYALAYGYDTEIGPIRLIRSWSPDTGNQRLYFSLGLWF